VAGGAEGGGLGGEADGDQEEGQAVARTFAHGREISRRV
jgi:hypothetical protein